MAAVTGPLSVGSGDWTISSDNGGGDTCTKSGGLKLNTEGAIMGRVQPSGKIPLQLTPGANNDYTTTGGSSGSGPCGETNYWNHERPHQLARGSRRGHVTGADPIALPTPHGGPEARLLDARPADLGEHELGALARSICQAGSAPFASRSYRYPYAMVAWHTGPVGIDVERIEHCDAGFATTMCTPAESAEWWSVGDPHGYFSSMWSSKEALAKALGSDGVSPGMDVVTRGGNP